MVVRGEAGVGKSVLGLRRRARADFTLLRGVGVEGESGLAYAALHLILHLRPGWCRPPPGTTGVGHPRGVRPVGCGRRRKVRRLAGCLGLLSQKAEESPVLCLVDDAQWLDQASADALLFAARRLERERLVMVFAVRDPDDCGFVARGLPEVQVGALGSGEARELLATQLGSGVTAAAIEWLVDNAHGNPLAPSSSPRP